MRIDTCKTRMRAGAGLYAVLLHACLPSCGSRGARVELDHVLDEMLGRACTFTRREPEADGLYEVGAGLTQQAVLVRGGGRDWRAFHKWNTSFLEDMAGEAELPVIRVPQGGLFPFASMEQEPGRLREVWDSSASAKGAAATSSYVFFPIAEEHDSSPGALRKGSLLEQSLRLKAKAAWTGPALGPTGIPLPNFGGPGGPTGGLWSSGARQLGGLLEDCEPNPPAFISANGIKGQRVFFSAGGTGTGLGFHEHAAAYNVVVSGGAKYWLVAPPAAFKRLDAIELSAGRETLIGDHSSPARLLKMAADASAEGATWPFDAMRECVQEAGDLVYVPAGWYHAVVNLAATAPEAATVIAVAGQPNCKNSLPHNGGAREFKDCDATKTNNPIEFISSSLNRASSASSTKRERELHDRGPSALGSRHLP
jgi:hypothetical protein